MTERHRGLGTVLKFRDSLDWWIAFRDPRDILQNHPTYLLAEIAFYLFALLTLRHALRHGGRYRWVWVTTLLHGLTTEAVSYFLPDIDNFWHGQSMIMLLGKRLPLHIACFYPAFYYTANVAVGKLRLKSWAEPFAVGLAVVAIDVPFDIMGIKLLWWTWHDTDPNIFDRHYWVPWTSYYFHATFASSFSFLFHNTRKLMMNTEKYESGSFFKELFCSIITGVFSFAGGTLQFLPIYHVFHDNFDIHTEVCVLILVAFYFLVVWSADRNPLGENRSNNKGKSWLDELGIIIVIHYAIYAILVVFAKPENVKSYGLHETVGPCDQVSPVNTASGQVLSKKTFLCPTGHDEGYFDWHCRPGGKPPKNGSDWYLVCGNEFPNHTEYILVVSAACAFGLFVFYQILAKSGALLPARFKGKYKSS